MTDFDNRGTVPQLGNRVAFNISGQVAKGIVKDIRPSARYGRVGKTYHVELEHAAAGMPRGHVSKVRDATSLLVLFEAGA
jgi:hypothetical protein